MNIEITKNVTNHKYNDEYPCLLVHFDPNKDQICVEPYKGSEHPSLIDDINWLPRFSNLEKIIKKMIQLDPEFGRRVKEILRDQERETPAVKENGGVEK